MGEKLAVLSGGPSRLSCDALPLTPEQIAKSSRSLYAGPSDVVVVVALRPRQPVDWLRRSGTHSKSNYRST